MVRWLQRNSQGNMVLWAATEKKSASFFRSSCVVVVMGLRGARHRGHLGALGITVPWGPSSCV